ncbi:unnamed protein product [Bemisia tabaci]|uniref:Peptidase C1A papain C-terminal domain-containing protein n=1 Tax=Bemisia tabaci TaxID=7038 RepID=A0A9P0ANX5_BEMTA|nr:unnamed protein product [Bemisia tabaci]
MFTDLIDCDRTNNGCMGGHTSNSLNYIRDVGIATARAYPYQAGQFGCRSNQIKPYVKLTTFIESDPSNIEGHLELSPIPTAVHHPPELQADAFDVLDDSATVRHDVPGANLVKISVELMRRLPSYCATSSTIAHPPAHSGSSTGAFCKLTHFYNRLRRRESLKDNSCDKSRPSSESFKCYFYSTCRGSEIA